MGNEWGSFGNDEDHTFVILGVGRGVRVEAITVVLVAKFFDDRFPLIVFEVGFSKDEDVVGGEPLTSLPKWCFLIQTTLICVYHIILKEDAEKVLKSPSFYPPTGQGLIFT